MMKTSRCGEDAVIVAFPEQLVVMHISGQHYLYERLHFTRILHANALIYFNDRNLHLELSSLKLFHFFQRLKGVFIFHPPS
jgi:hypothetical protein